METTNLAPIFLPHLFILICLHLFLPVRTFAEILLRHKKNLINLKLLILSLPKT